jgi:hypothetical protein
MSEMKGCAEFAKYDTMPTEDLQEILRKHAHDELQVQMDLEELYYIMEVLADRRYDTPEQAAKETEEAYANFRKHYMPKGMQEGKTKVIQFPNRVFRTVAAVLVLVLILAVGTSITAEALQIDIWGKFATWTKEIFQFTDNPQGTTAPNPEQEYNAELKSLQDALAQEGIEERLAPTWMPKEYKSIDLKVISTPRVRNINAVYEKNDEQLIIKIRQTIGAPADQVEKNDDLLEVYVVDGVEYYIFSNTETLQAAWSIGEFECVIISKITLEEMKMMIDSIK